MIKENRMHDSEEKFSIDLSFRHDSPDPESISHALARQPDLEWKAGEPVLDRLKNVTCWRGSLAFGSGAIGFHEAMEKALSILTQQRDFFLHFKTSGGEIEITLKRFVDMAAVLDFKDGKEQRTEFRLFEMEFNPEFLKCLADMKIALRFELWT